MDRQNKDVYGFENFCEQQLNFFRNFATSNVKQNNNK